MSKKDDMYTRADDDDSQVRNIIRRLNEERPATEKSREVVVRADGTKAIRVTKKRKMLMTNEERNRRSRRAFILLLLSGMLACLVAVGFFMYRMTSMTGEYYLTSQGTRLCEAWGASQMKCAGASIEGMQLSIAHIVVDFPDASMLQRVELRDVKASLSAASFISGKIKTDELSIGHARVVLNPQTRLMNMPRHQGDDLWNIKRVVCDDLNVSFGDNEAESPIVLRQASAYMYGPTSVRVLMLSDGLLMLKGWKPISLADGKMRFTPTSIEDISLRGTIDPSRKTPDGRLASSLYISGSLPADSSLSGPLMFDSDNMNLAEFSDGAFVHFFSATTQKLPTKKHPQNPAAYITLPLDAEKPLFHGTFHVRDIRVTSFPAMMIFTEHIDPKYRRQYLPPYISFGAVSISDSPEGGKVLSIAENDMIERDLISLRANVTVDASNQLHGTLDYGLPTHLTRVEYPDGLSDPIFNEDGRYAWLCTQVSGAANRPTDNAEQLDVEAESQRKYRPARTPFDQIDVDKLNERIQAAATVGSGTVSEAVSAEKAPDSIAPSQPQPEVHSSQKSLESSTLPTGGGLTLPVEPGLFGGGL